MSAMPNEVGLDKTNPATFQLSFDGKLLARGFWLYVWEITTPAGKKLCYVGRTGDSSSLNAQSPFNRMSQHLGFNKNNNVLRRRLKKKKIEPDLCHFRLVAHGPILAESKDETEYRRRRDIIAALEKHLAEALDNAGYTVMNRVACAKSEQLERFSQVREAFAVDFPNLKKLNGGKETSLKPINIDADRCNSRR